MSCQEYTYITMQLSRILDMKKLIKELIFISIALCQLSTAHAGQCGTHSIDLFGLAIIQNRSDNEFLYGTHAAYLRSKETHSRGFVESKVYECDNKACPVGTIVIMGKDHAFDGEKIEEITAYYCEKRGGDKWIKINDIKAALKTDNAIISDEAKKQLDELCAEDPDNVPQGYKCPDGTGVGTAAFAAEETTYPPLNAEEQKRYADLIKVYEEDLEKAEKVYEKQCGKSLLEKVLSSSKK